MVVVVVVVVVVVGYLFLRKVVWQLLDGYQSQVIARVSIMHVAACRSRIALLCLFGQQAHFSSSPLTLSPLTLTARVPSRNVRLGVHSPHLLILIVLLGPLVPPLPDEEFIAIGFSLVVNVIAALLCFFREF